LGLYYNRARYLNPNTGRFWTVDAFEGNNQDPLSLHKYLYAHGNPVNNVDPNGQFALAELTASSAIRLVVIAAVTTSLGYTYVSTRNLFTGSPPTTGQQQKLDSARSLIERSSLPPTIRGYANEARTVRVRVHKKKDDFIFGYARAYFHFGFFDTIHIYDHAIDLDDELLASLLIHEAVHVKQWIQGEQGAYQVESDFLRAVGVDGTFPDVVNQFPGDVNRTYLHVTAKQYQRYGVERPAVH